MTEQETTDVIVVGGGPAGLSAALWCNELGLETILFEKEAELGGQLLQIFNPITNYLGLKTENGREMRDHFERGVEKMNSFTRLRAAVKEIDAAGHCIVLSGGERCSAKALIIATGVRRRKLGVAGEDFFQGKGILDSGAKDKEKVTNKKVLIVGGGDAAIENSLILSDYAAKIYVVHRRANLSARTEFINRAKMDAKIELSPDTIVREIIGNDRLKSVEVVNTETDQAEVLDVDFVLVRIGVEPNTELLRGKINLDDKGYVLIDSNCETSSAGVFAVGDAANPISPTLSTAAGTGATAAKAVRSLLNRKEPV